MVTIELIDFTCHHNKDELSSDQVNDNDHIKYLLNLLKSTIRNNRYKKYSLQFESIGKLESIGSFYNYDIVVSERYNILVTAQSTYIIIYNRITSFNQMPISDKILFKVDIDIELKCLKLNTEKDEEFIYASTYDNAILKINLTKLLETRQYSLIWKSEIFSNLWGVDILNDTVYAIQYGSRIITLLDCESGKTLDEDPKLPNIMNGYQLIFISPKEMIISHAKCVELFHLNEDKWKSVSRTSFPIESAYSIFYERESQLIYLSDTEACEGETIKVINSKDLSLVKSFGDFNMNYGICIDRLSGLLYVCDTCNYYIEVLK